MSLLGSLKHHFAKIKTDINQTTPLQVPACDHERQERLDALTPREHDVFLLLVEGYTIKESAQQLGISYSAVNGNMTAIYKKLGIKSRAELIIQYRKYSPNAVGQDG